MVIDFASCACINRGSGVWQNERIGPPRIIECEPQRSTCQRSQPLSCLVSRGMVGIEIHRYGGVHDEWDSGGVN